MIDSFDADEAVDGGSITSWNDINPQTTTKHNLLAGDAPTYNKNIINGLPVVSFNGSSNYLTDSQGINLTGEITVFAVAETNAISSSWLSLFDNNPGGNIGYRSGLGSTPSTIRFTTGGVRDYFSNTGQWVAQVPMIVSIIYNSSFDVAFFKNGGEAGTSDYNLPMKPSTGAFTVGANGIGTGSFWNGYICELIIYDRVLSTSEREDVEDYLSQKWGIDLQIELQ